MSQCYKESDITALLKHYYPYKWKSVGYKYSYYQQEDKYVKKRFGRIRFGMKEPDSLLRGVNLYKRITSLDYK